MAQKGSGQFRPQKSSPPIQTFLESIDNIVDILAIKIDMISPK
jgi:hypothetical protein